MPNPADSQGPDHGAALSFYSGESGKSYHDEKRALSASALPVIMRLRARKFQRHVRPEHTVLEYGVGSGWNLGQLKCARRIGFDAAHFLEDRLKPLGIEFITNIAHLPDAAADVVLCHHVLEHLPTPIVALNEIKRVLKPGGKLILHVPWEREWRFRHFIANEPNHHLYTWNAQTLGNLLSLTGFTIHNIAVRRYGYDRFSANLAARLSLGLAGCRIIRRLIITLRPLHEIEAIAVAKVGNPTSSQSRAPGGNLQKTSIRA